MRRVGVWMLAWSLGACLHAPGVVEPGACLPGTVATLDSDSDVGWGEVERVNGCAKPDGTLDGPAIEMVDGGKGMATKLVGRYANGVRVGTWTQYNDGSGAKIGSFTLDGSGSGVEVVRDAVGHYRRGAVVNGRRDGIWTYHDRDGTVVATRVWSRGQFVRASGRPAWDPPMIDPDDVCPRDAGARANDGCPPK